LPCENENSPASFKIRKWVRFIDELLEMLYMMKRFEGARPLAKIDETEAPN
jgi:hypothetical protein